MTGLSAFLGMDILERWRIDIMHRKGKELKSGWFGIYKGNEYELTSDMDGNRIILTKNKNIVDNTFSYDYKYNSGIYRKIIDNAEIEYAYELNLYALVDGVKIGVMKETEDEYLVCAFRNRQKQDIIEKYNLKEVERSVFEGWIPKKYVELLEERRELQYNPETKDLEFKD